MEQFLGDSRLTTMLFALSMATLLLTMTGDLFLFKMK